MNSPHDQGSPCRSKTFMNNNQRKRMPRVSGQKTAPSKSPKSRRNRRKKKAQGRKKISPYLRTISDPCNIQGVRIPDGQMFPTTTGHMRYIFTIARPADVKRTIILSQPATIGLNSIISGAFSTLLLVIHYVEDSSGNKFYYLDSTYSTGHSYAAKGLRDALVSLTPTTRTVSGCLSVEFTGDSLYDGGRIVSALVPAGQMVSLDSIHVSASSSSSVYTRAKAWGADPYILSRDALENLQKASLSRLRHGAEVLYVPSDRQDLQFVEGQANNASAIYYGEGTSLVHEITWSAVGTAVQSVVVRFDANYEGLSRSAGGPVGKVVTNEPSALSQVAEWASYIGNIIRPYVPQAIALGKHLLEPGPVQQTPYVVEL